MKGIITANKRRLESLWVLLILFILGGLLLHIRVTSDGFGFGGDSFNHYNFSRFSWKHPELLLNNWAKPFFTLVSSPFAQLGFKGIEIFNILCGLITGFILYKVGQKLDLRASWTVLPFLIFTPVYLFNLPSGYTEPFFGLVTSLAAYLIIVNRPALAAILASFLPFIRSEGFILLPVFFVVFAFRREFRYIPLLIAGLVIYSLVGYPFKGELLWVFSGNPYKFDNSIYGKGTLDYFFNKSTGIFGTPLLILFGMGFFYTIFRLVKDFSFFIKSKVFHIILIMTGGTLAYFMAHVVFWWQGIYGSLGLTRVMAGIAPGVAFTSLFGFQVFFQIFSNANRWIKWVPWIVLIGAIYWVVRKPYELKNFPVQVYGEHKFVREAALWFKNSRYFPPEKFYYVNQVIPVYTNLDPFDHSRIKKLHALDKKHPVRSIPENAIVYWDAHYGPNEAGIPKEKLLNHPSMEVLKHIKPEPGFKVLGDNEFEIYFFRKKSSLP